MKAPCCVRAVAMAVLATFSCVPSISDASDAGRAAEDSRHIQFLTDEVTRPSIEVSPDGSELLFDALGDIYRVPVGGGAAKKMDLGSGWKSRPRLAPDGHHIAYFNESAKDSGIWVAAIGASVASRSTSLQIHKNGLDAHWLGNTEVATVHSTDISDSSTLMISRVARSGARSTRSQKFLTGVIRQMVGADSSTGKLYFYDYKGGLESGDVRTGSISAVAEGQKAIAGQVKISRDGKLIGYAEEWDGESQLTVYNPALNSRTRTKCRLEPRDKNDQNAWPRATYDFLPGNNSVVLSRSGKFYRCALNGAEHAIPIEVYVDISIAQMARARHLGKERTQILYPILSADRGEVFYSAYGSLWKYNLSRHHAERIFKGGGEALMPSQSPDGASIAFVTNDDGVAKIVVMRLKDGSQKVICQSTENIFANPSWSPDGSRIAFIESNHIGRMGADYPKHRLKVLDISARKVTDLGARVLTNQSAHIYARPTWSKDGRGVFYNRYKIGTGYIEHIELIYQEPLKEPQVVLTADVTAQDILVSPDQNHVAIQDRLRISIFPMPALADGKNKARHLDINDLARGSRYEVNGVDFISWVGEADLLWSIQDEVFLGQRLGAPIALLRVEPRERKMLPERPIAYSGGTIITLSDQGVIHDGAVVVMGKTIAFVGRSRDVPAQFKNAQLVDIKGKTIIPGLIDVHRHHNYYMDDVGLQEDYQLFANAAYGVTTVYDALAPTVKSSYLMDLSRQDSFVGARYFGSGAALLGSFYGSHYSRIENDEDANRFVERQAIAGVPLVKSYARTSRNEVALIAKAARELGLGVASHEDSSPSRQLQAVADGYTSLEHYFDPGSTPIYKDILEFLKLSKVSLTSTLADDQSGYLGAVMWSRTRKDDRFACLVGRDNEARFNPLSVDNNLLNRDSDGDPIVPKFVMDKVIEHASLLKSGGRVNIGAHFTPPGLGTHWEMWTLVLGGASPFDALRAGTVNGALKLNLQDRIGSLALGMEADFVILNSSPLESIYNTVDIAQVVNRGRVVQWPSGSRWPLTWPRSSEWQQCKVWNLGVETLGRADSSTANQEDDYARG